MFSVSAADTFLSLVTGWQQAFFDMITNISSEWFQISPKTANDFIRLEMWEYPFRQGGRGRDFSMFNSQIKQTRVGLLASIQLPSL